VDVDAVHGSVQVISGSVPFLDDSCTTWQASGVACSLQTMILQIHGATRAVEAVVSSVCFVRLSGVLLSIQAVFSVYSIVQEGGAVMQCEWRRP
jgi:hypothetical protein